MLRGAFFGLSSPDIEAPEMRMGDSLEKRPIGRLQQNRRRIKMHRKLFPPSKLTVVAGMVSQVREQFFGKVQDAKRSSRTRSGAFCEFAAAAQERCASLCAVGAG